eukprot:SM000118S25619  [mRNA]  locus=s118:372481:375146:- [translate_table: standard]
MLTTISYLQLADLCEPVVECSHFSRCDRDRSSVSAICGNTGLQDNFTRFPPPINLASAVPGDDAGGPSEALMQLPYQGLVFVLEDVFVDNKGRVFNATHHFLDGTCTYLDAFEYSANATQVTEFDLLANLVNWNFVNFFHTVTELVLDFIVMEKVLQAHPGIPIAFRAGQDRGKVVQPWLSLIGWSVERLNVQGIANGELLFAKKLLVPAHGLCGKPNRSTLRKLQQEYLGVATEKKALSNWKFLQMTSMGPKGKIVLGRRKRGRSRFLNQEAEILSGLKERYGQKRVRSFWGNETIAELKALFGDAVLYIGPHGAGLANTIFMAPGSALLEIRPNAYTNTCHHHIADLLDVQYYLYLAKGNFTSPMDADVAKVLALAHDALPQAWGAGVRPVG